MERSWPSTDWTRTRWWRAVGADGEVWFESSDEREVRERARPGDRIQVLMERIERRWEDRD
jgi:hypothetical protein